MSIRNDIVHIDTFLCCLAQRRKSGEPRHEDEVFELLFTHMALNLFTEPEQAMDILKVHF